MAINEMWDMGCDVIYWGNANQKLFTCMGIYI